ncbi:E3 SUMO-protein ligase ZBED1-like [Rana temporaria]|uniref:E3 SUMO-protein ligase ZBED1-like n=2 Tax=Rana temporaria TaxID=8407 RepID=UPI001AAD42E9|nr:E3 SUMO-protein ligase ZBED1-like [Rana temporaria]XP_040214667.1 E3 SUMO-protein ligase ZBED1-like [Rana temporaria]XP_040216672.1 E3 SUMO-protein ligase ZBED1-like [Rana temporaria]
MASGGKEELERPASFKSPVWDHFGFPVKYDHEGKRMVDKTVTACRHCGTRKPYDSGNTSSMATHLKRHHPGVPLTVTGVKTKAVQQPLITAAFKQPLIPQSDRAKAITKAIGVFIGADMRPYSIVQNEGFKHMLNVLEPRYNIPSRTHFSEKVVPELYEQEKKKVVDELSQASSVALTTDGWTSRGTESYITITAHFITADWEMRSPVLQTRPLYESHTSAHLAQVLTEAVDEWKLKRPSTNIPVTTDNAKNQVNAVIEAGLGPQIGCFAHVVNLASQKGISVSRMDRLLGRIRKVVSYFHRSTTAAHVLKTKQEMLKLPKHKLINDVPTRWNSTYDMLERYLEQQAAIYSALTDKTLKKIVKDIITLSDDDVRVAEEVLQVLQPLKMVTSLLSTESSPSVSMIMPLKTRILQSMAPGVEDSTITQDVKTAIREDLQPRYTSPPTLQDYLHRSTALDPRFKSLSHMDPALRQRTYSDLTTEIVSSLGTKDCDEGQAQAAEPTGANLDSSSPPQKKSAMAELFGETFASKDNKTSADIIKEEVESYLLAASGITVDGDPMTWWKSNECKYPHVAKMARCYLAVPGSSVPSERVFSTAGDIVTAQRSTLSPENVDILVFLKKNLKL